MLIARHLALFLILWIAFGDMLTTLFASARAAEVGTVLAYPTFAPIAAPMTSTARRK